MIIINSQQVCAYFLWASSIAPCLGQNCEMLCYNKPSHSPILIWHCVSPWWFFLHWTGSYEDIIYIGSAGSGNVVEDWHYDFQEDENYPHNVIMQRLLTGLYKCQVVDYSDGMIHERAAQVVTLSKYNGFFKWNYCNLKFMQDWSRVMEIIYSHSAT